jgi:hypothetical protein
MKDFERHPSIGTPEGIWLDGQALKNTVEAAGVAEQVSLSSDEIFSFNLLLKKSTLLSGARKKELTLKHSAGVNTLKEDAFREKTSEAVSFTGNLVYYMPAEGSETPYRPANNFELQRLRSSYDQQEINNADQTGVVGTHLLNPAFWRAVEVSSLVLPMVVLISERRLKQKFGPARNDEVAEFAEALAEINKMMALYTDMDDPLFLYNGDANYLSRPTANPLG